LASFINRQVLLRPTEKPNELSAFFMRRLP
jgi:hypothetical protein